MGVQSERRNPNSRNRMWCYQTRFNATTEHAIVGFSPTSTNSFSVSASEKRKRKTASSSSRCVLHDTASRERFPCSGKLSLALVRELNLLREKKIVIEEESRHWEMKIVSYCFNVLLTIIDRQWRLESESRENFMTVPINRKHSWFMNEFRWLYCRNFNEDQQTNWAANVENVENFGQTRQFRFGIFRALLFLSKELGIFNQHCQRCIYSWFTWFTEMEFYLKHEREILWPKCFWRWWTCFKIQIFLFVWMKIN